MFYSLTGKLVLTTESSAVVDCGGIAFRLSVSANTLSKLTHIGETVCLYTHFAVREDAFELFGFFSEEELDAFRLLIGVSGIGPKAGLAILSVLTPERLSAAVAAGDAHEISKAQGVGAKTASRVILELRDKIGKKIAPASNTSAPTSPSSREKVSEAQDALIVLGYKRSEAEEILRHIDVTNLDVEGIIREALKYMMK